MTLVDAFPFWISRIAARLKFGKETAEVYQEATEEVVEESGGLGGALVKTFLSSIWKVMLFFVGFLLIAYLIIRRIEK